ncbi:protein NATD1 isoform X1 [Xiphophorus hellerii]|uniref:protein NATD1 isoform X1 n=1 Tax=Xiphophorus hellerii TaxID=8084 RepID=UPI0013B4644C|nr:protein NATD1-like isoform X1 [Xiphophorus hellerii]
MAQANSFDANSSQIQVEHDKKRRQFVIRLNGLQLPFQAQLLSSAHDNEASQKLVFSGGFLNNKPNQTYFFLKSKGSHDRAVLLYEYVGKKTVDLQHTEVPDAYRGRGIAKHLAKAAMDFVVEEDLKAHLTCWYIQKYVKENPQPQYFEHIHQ